jgi:hypothetical protein
VSGQNGQWATGTKITVGGVVRGALFLIILPAAFALFFFVIDLISRAALTP